VHFVKSDRLLSENSPWMTTDALGFWINSIPVELRPENFRTGERPVARKYQIVPTDLISILSEMLFRSRIIFWKSVVGRFMTVEYSTSGTTNSLGRAQSTAVLVVALLDVAVVVLKTQVRLSRRGSRLSIYRKACRRWTSWK
jgi:hypothetical protein